MREELIQKYFKESLSEEELVEFNQLRAIDDNFVKEVIDYQSVLLAVQSAEREELKRNLQLLEKKKAKNSMYKKLAVAASFIGVIGIGSLIFSNMHPSGKTLFAKNFEAYPNVVAPITRSVKPTKESEKYFVAYEKGEYKMAIEGFKKQLKSEDNGDIRFYIAMSYLNSENEDVALKELQLIKKNTTDFYPQVVWYQALIHIENENFDSAKELLNELIALESSYKKKEAKELLEEIK